MGTVTYLRDRAPYRYGNFTFDELVSLVLDIMADGDCDWSERELVDLVRRLQRATRLEFPC